MRRTETFRLQHAELLGLADRVERALSPPRVRAGADTLRGVLALLARVLTRHAALEDDELYPLLLKHVDERIRGKARALRHEFGVIYASVEVAVTVWSRPGAIEAEPERFVGEMRTIFDVLRERIALEDDDLYVLIDAL